MDPAAMDFMMHHHQSNLNNAASLENGAYTHCPALRSAADPQSLLNSPTRGTHHYDPVHGNTTYRHRWRAQQQPQRAWHPLRTDQPSHRADQASQDPFQASSAPGLPQANHTNQSPFSLLAEAETYRLHTPPYHYRPPMPALPRMGSTAPAQHIHGNHANSGQVPAGAPNMALHRGHIQRTGSSLPGVNPVSHQTLTQSIRPSAMSTENTTPAQQTTDQFSPLDYLRQDNVPSTSFSRPEANMQARSAGESGNSQSGVYPLHRALVML
ncbi:hypothetical protein F4775DRAFT_212844 [Biscogniauxia sp. FL1348]|nr:hypothetical protein F4775DRAFT_212844 [Biscogniauxia sp. FL1348]